MIKNSLLALVASLAVSCSQGQSDHHQVTTVPTDTVVIEACDPSAQEARCFHVIESAPNSFVRIVPVDDMDRKQLTTDVASLIKTYPCVFVCRPGHTDRGEEYLSIFDGVVIDYDSGETVNLETWLEHGGEL